ncbi:chemoreceptor glutamine deamidase CheD [Mesoterricola silvestris]|uniref:Probable chemoreceptor glutamine deamidase CheD n=1 Tax=Mesoterricola silvestris TaxID=2927979 RepID=A0AA48GVH6_9BACT|nr:chemoreceptor glutamine deamidase CheD [Mesoterricola silvestris]BDU72586.1 putative chemoreceptor glutamine deamidase CheD 1 [Mesoterricola silvestris]
MSPRLKQPVPERASRYFDRHFQCPAMKILPGEFYATGADEAIVTVLGSCVAVCLLDPVLAIGGMNHFMLPIQPEPRQDDPYYAARYGAGAMELLINEMLHLGAGRQRLVAKVFGGGQVMAGLSDIGQRNALFIRDFLRVEGIPRLAEDLGGSFPLKVYFFPATGQVLVKRISKLRNRTLVRREQAYFARLSQGTDEPDVELFP